VRGRNLKRAFGVRQAVGLTHHVKRAARRVIASRYRQAFGRGVQTGHSEACSGQVIRQKPAAATHIQHSDLAGWECQANVFGNPGITRARFGAQ